VLPLCPPDHMGVSKRHGAECNNPGKVPLVQWTAYQDALPSERDVRDWWRHNPTANLGAATGPVSGVVRADVDGEEAEAELLKASAGDLPETWEFTSGRDDGAGRGLLYGIPAGVELRTTVWNPNAPKQELRFQAKGAQTVLPPSRHHKGGLYAWRPGH